MKQLIKYLFVAVISLTTLTFTACNKSNEDEQQPAAAATPAGHTFMGTNENAGTFPYQGTNLPVQMTITAQITSESQGKLVFDLVIGGQPQNPSTLDVSYTLEGTNGAFKINTSTAPFTWDATNKTISLSNFFVTIHDQEGNSVAVGGDFVLAQQD